MIWGRSATFRTIIEEQELIKSLCKRKHILKSLPLTLNCLVHMIYIRDSKVFRENWEWVDKYRVLCFLPCEWQALLNLRSVCTAKEAFSLFNCLRVNLSCRRNDSCRVELYFHWETTYCDLLNAYIGKSRKIV